MCVCVLFQELGFFFILFWILFHVSDLISQALIVRILEEKHGFVNGSKEADGAWGRRERFGCRVEVEEEVAVD
jgi:hypothetical protein